MLLSFGIVLSITGEFRMTVPMCARAHTAIQIQAMTCGCDAALTIILSLKIAE
jgi:hypothetical protein